MLLTIIGALLAAAPATGANPIAPALAGQVECQRPNEQAKTCRSMATYRPLGGARYSNSALILLSPQGPVTLRVTSDVEVKHGAVCGLLRREDLDKGTLMVGDHVLGAKEAAPGLGQVAQAMASLLGKEICTTYESTASGLVGRLAVDGVARPEFDVPVKLVGPGDGYKVAP
ncbi:hypothetical protein [Sphingomonas crusticola]|uniref:hypothetical protein n=1 Tax=Sphingomonas crusticola TaxID=1697973 RepID=UPI000E279C22|nr:hypothetical protein [Sphingomonas crusticola]